MEDSMTHHTMTPDTFEPLLRLYEQLETQWNDQRDPATVDRLAAEHPQFATELYEFFAILVEAASEVHPSQRNPATAHERARAPDDAVSARVHAWLVAEGHARAAELARQVRPDASSTPPPVNGSPAALGGVGGTLSDAQSDASLGAGARAAPRQNAAPRTFLSLLKERTHKRTQALAEVLGVDTSFLVGLDALHDPLPRRVAEELALRANSRLKIARSETLPSLIAHRSGSESAPLPLPRAASRTSPFESPLSFGDLVHYSAMSSTEKQFWLALATDAPGPAV